MLFLFPFPVLGALLLLLLRFFCCVRVKNLRESAKIGGIHEKSRFINRWLNQPNEGRVCSCVFPGPIGGAWWCWFASLVVFNGTSFFNFFATHTQNRLLSPLLRLHTTPWLISGSSGTPHVCRSSSCSLFVCRNHLIGIIEQLYVFWIR